MNSLGESLDTFRDLVERELKNQSTDEEKNFLQSSEETLKKWGQVLRLLETETMAQLTNQKQVMEIQRENIALHANPGQERTDALQKWRLEVGQYHKEKIRKLTRRLNFIRLRRKVILLQLKEYEQQYQQQIAEEQAEKKTRKQQIAEERRRHVEEQEQLKLQYKERLLDKQQASAISYRTGWKDAIGKMLSLIRDGIDPDSAYELCKEYANVELKAYMEHPKSGKPPFPGISSQNSDTL